MKIASVADVKARFSAFLKSTEDGPVVVTRNGKPVAVLLAVADEDDVERLLLAHSPRFQAILQTAERQIREGQGIYHADFWKEIEEEFPQEEK
jgi:prevent-host-death family protein